MEISYCPYRTEITHNLSAVQTTEFSEPVTFSGDARDSKFPFQVNDEEGQVTNDSGEHLHSGYYRLPSHHFLLLPDTN